MEDQKRKRGRPRKNVSKDSIVSDGPIDDKVESNSGDKQDAVVERRPIHRMMIIASPFVY